MKPEMINVRTTVPWLDLADVMQDLDILEKPVESRQHIDKIRSGRLYKNGKSVPISVKTRSTIPDRAIKTGI